MTGFINIYWECIADMVSFIVIGWNEGWRLTLCFESIFDAVKENCLSDFEVIYVDSKSIDASIDTAKRYSTIRIFCIEGKCNAAIARNVGAGEAKGDILVFIDGDMKLDAGFLASAIRDNGNLIYPFLTGIYKHCYYDWHNVVQKEKVFDTITNDLFVKTTGGFFVITKELWQKVGGIDVRLDRNEDIDLGLRLCKINMPPLKLAKICINHYTFADRLTDNLLEYAFYYRYSSVVARRHLLNIHYLPMFLRMNYTSIFLFAALILSLVNVYFLPLYALLILMRAFMNRTNRSIVMMLHYFLRDVVFVFSFFLYYPNASAVLYRKCSDD